MPSKSTSISADIGNPGKLPLQVGEAREYAGTAHSEGDKNSQSMGSCGKHLPWVDAGFDVIEAFLAGLREGGMPITGVQRVGKPGQSMCERIAVILAVFAVSLSSKLPNLGCPRGISSIPSHLRGNQPWRRGHDVNEMHPLSAPRVARCGCSSERQVVRCWRTRARLYMSVVAVS